MIKKIRLSLLLLLFVGFKLHSQPSSHAKSIDSLQRQLNIATDSNKVDILTELSQYYKPFNAQKALDIAREAYRNAQKLSYLKGSIASLTQMGNAYQTLQELDNALSCYQQTLDIAIRKNLTLEKVQALRNIGYNYNLKSNFPQAIKYSNRALSLSNKINNKKLTSIILNDIGNTLYNQSNYPKALNYFLQAANIAEQVKDKNIILKNKISIGNIYNDIGEYSKALSYFQEALQIKKQISNTPSIGILYNIGNVYYGKRNHEQAIKYYALAYQNSLKVKSQIGISNILIKLGDTYYQLKDYKTALESYNKAITDSLPQKLLATAYLGLSNTFRELKDTERSLKYGQNALKISRELGIKVYVQEAYLSLAKTYAARNNYLKAFQYQSKHLELKDSIFNNENSQRIAILQNTHELDSKQAQINLLAKTKQLQQAQIHKQNLVKDILIVGIALILVFSMFMFNAFREKQKANNKLQEQNDEILRIGEELQKTQQKLRTALSSGLVGTWSFNAKEKLIYFDENASRMFGLSFNPKGFASDDIANLVFPEDRGLEKKFREQYIKNDIEHQAEYRILKDENIIWILARGKAEYNAEKNLIAFTGVVIDITERKQAEQHKDEFLSIASHELKTPLTSIKGYLQLAQNSLDITHPANNFVNKSINQLKRLERLTSDLMDATRMSSGKLHYKITEFNFEHMLRDIIDSMQLTISSHKIIIKETVSVEYKGDRYRIEQVINNFLNNAVKYSPNSDVIIINAQKEESNVLVSIQDFGIGIEKRHLEHLHERFYRISNSFPKFEGLGLGLYIASEILKHHGGRFWVQSEPGKGSIFYFSLPILNEERLNSIQTPSGITAANTSKV
jgi:PAS domain S-box-containing protein